MKRVLTNLLVLLICVPVCVFCVRAVRKSLEVEPEQEQKQAEELDQTSSAHGPQPAIGPRESPQPGEQDRTGRGPARQAEVPDAPRAAGPSGPFLSPARGKLKKARAPRIPGVARLAILPGEGKRAPSPVLVAELEVALSQEDKIELVERAEISRIVAELELSASGLTDPGAVVKLGELIAADLFVFVERLPKSKLLEGDAGPDICAIQALDMQTGIGLLALAAPENELVGDVSPAVESVKRALAKVKVLLSERRFVGLLGFRSEEPGYLLDQLAEALDMFAYVDLSGSREIMTLDREHLSRLRAEEGLTGAELQLRTSTVLLSSGLKRSPGGDDLLLTLYLRPLMGGAEEKVSIKEPLKDLAAIRRSIVRAVTEKLRTGIAETGTADPRVEAAAFMGRAKLHSALGEHRSAMRAAEAALALDPSAQHHVDAITVYAEYVYHYFLEYKESKATMLRAKLRQVQLARAALDKHLSHFPTPPVEVGGGMGMRAGSYPAYPAFMVRAFFLTPLKVFHEEEEAKRLQGEILKTIVPLHRDLIRKVEASPDKGYMKWSLAATLPESAIWFQNAAAWGELMREVVPLFASTRPQDLVEFPMLQGKVHRILFFRVCGRVASAREMKLFYWPEERKTFEETLDWLAKHDNKHVRLTGSAAKAIWSRSQDPGAGQAFLDTLIGHYGPQEWGGYSMEAAAALKALKESPALVDRYTRTIADHLAESPWSAELCRWQGLIGARTDALEQLGRTDEAARWGREILAKFEQIIADSSRGGGINLMPRNSLERPHQILARTERFAARLKEKIARMSPGGVGMPEQLPGPWRAYEITRIPLRGDLGGCKRLAVLARDREDLILIWEGAQHWFHRINRLPLAGQVQRTVGTMRGRAILYAAAAHRDRIFVSIRGQGIAELGDGVKKFWTEKTGLPDNKVHGLASYGGKLYLGLGDHSLGNARGALTEFDPATGRYQVLASTWATEKRGPLDGLRYELTRVVPDPYRDCCWLVARKTRSKFHTLKQFHPKTGEITEAPFTLFQWYEFKADYYIASIQDLLVYPKYLLVCTVSGKVFIVDPTDYQCFRALTRAPEARSLFGQHHEDQRTMGWPAFLVGQELLVCPGQLRLYRLDGTDPSILTHAPDGTPIGEIVHSVPIENGVIVATRDGRLWRIQRRGPVVPLDLSDPALRYRSSERIAQDFRHTTHGSRALGPDLVLDLITWDKLSDEDLQKTRDYGLRVAGVAPGADVARADLKPDDVILTIDGYRVYGPGEYALVYFSELTPGMSVLRVNRGGQVRVLSVRQTQPKTGYGFEFKPDRRRLVKLLDGIGLPVAEDSEAALAYFPARATMRLELWLAADPANRGKAGWVRDYVALYLALVNQEYANAKAPRQRSPIPLFNRLADFYLSIARRHQDGEQEPDWKSHDESLDFYVLYYPFPIAPRKSVFYDWLLSRNKSLKRLFPEGPVAEGTGGQVSTAAFCSARPDVLRKTLLEEARR